MFFVKYVCLIVWLLFFLGPSDVLLVMLQCFKSLMIIGIGMTQMINWMGWLLVMNLRRIISSPWLVLVPFHCFQSTVTQRTVVFHEKALKPDYSTLHQLVSTEQQTDKIRDQQLNCQKFPSCVYRDQRQSWKRVRSTFIRWTETQF